LGSYNAPLFARNRPRQSSGIAKGKRYAVFFPKPRNPRHGALDLKLGRVVESRSRARRHRLAVGDRCTFRHRRSFAPGTVMTICPTCGADDPCANPLFCAACREAGRRKAKLRRTAWNPPQAEPAEAPKATYDAVVYELRTHGVSQLSKPNCQRRLGDLSIAQLKNLITSLQQRRGQYPNVGRSTATTLLREAAAALPGGGDQ
jgi:hypothetical protein